VRVPLEWLRQIESAGVSDCGYDERRGQPSNCNDCPHVEQPDVRKTADPDHSSAGSLDCARRKDQAQLGGADAEARQPEDSCRMRCEIGFGRHEQVGGKQNDSEKWAHQAGAREPGEDERRARDVYDVVDVIAVPRPLNTPHASDRAIQAVAEPVGEQGPDDRGGGDAPVPRKHGKCEPDACRREQAER